MRECWINVYVRNGRQILGWQHATLRSANFASGGIYRLHVKLKDKPHA